MPEKYNKTFSEIYLKIRFWNVWLNFFWNYSVNPQKNKLIYAANIKCTDLFDNWKNRKFFNFHQCALIFNNLRGNSVPVPVFFIKIIFNIIIEKLFDFSLHREKNLRFLISFLIENKLLKKNVWIFHQLNTTNHYENNNC